MYNLIITAYRGEAKYLLKELSKHGEFKTTSYRDVLVGEVKSLTKLFKKINEEPPLSLARAIPINEVVKFKEPSKLLSTLKKKVLKHAKLKTKQSFRVTVERRGWKGKVNSHEWEQTLGKIVYDKTKNPVSLDNPDVEIVFEVMSDTCGITLISKAMKKKYYFIRTK